MRRVGVAVRASGWAVRACGCVGVAVIALALYVAPALAQEYDAPDPGGNEAAVVPTPPTQMNKLFGLNENIAGAVLGRGPGVFAELSHHVGANTVRFQIDWRLAEPEPVDWQEVEPDDLEPAVKWVWESWEHAVSSARRANMWPIIVLGLAPPWARDPVYQACTGQHLACRFPPARSMYGEWREFVAEVARRFGVLGAAIQVWNEPNLTFWWNPQPDPERYAELLHEAYEAVQEVEDDLEEEFEVRFEIPVIAGGIANNQDGNGGMPIGPYLAAAYEAPYPLAENMDYLGLNIFPYSNKFGKNTLLAKSFKDVRDAQAAAGDDTRILITETGLGSGKPWPFNEKQQARASMRLYQRLITMKDVAGVVFHRLTEPGPRGETQADPREWGFAWTRYEDREGVDLPPKPVYCLFAEHAGNFYPPCLETTIAKGPKQGARVKAGKKVVFKFKAPSLGAKFRCALDRKKLRPCKRRFNAGKKLRPGKHVLYVRAVDRNGNLGAKVKRKFAVKKAKKKKKKKAQKRKRGR